MSDIDISEFDRVAARAMMSSERERAATDETGPPVIGLRGARALIAGRQVDPTIREWGLAPEWYRRPFGRDENTLGVIKTIRDVDPQAAFATWNYLRLINPGHKLEAFDGTDITGTSGPSAKGQAVLDQLVTRVGGEYGGGLDSLHTVLALMLLTNGAVAAECAPTANLRDTEDWYPIDPTLLGFMRDNVTKRLLLGQRYKTGQFAILNTEQVFYLPLDPDVDDPFGRPPLLPAVGSVLSKTQLLNDLRAVAHNQGFPRIDVKVLWEAINNAAPASLRAPGREREFMTWAQQQLDLIVQDYANLQVDDTFVHYDWVDIGMVGQNYAASSFDFAGLEKILTRQLQASLKTLPILLGINDSISETHGSIQWQIQVAGILALQRLIKRLVEKLSNVSLRLAGINAHAHMAYDEIRAIDRLYEAQAAMFEFKNHQIAVQMGWETDDEAANEVLGHDATGEKMAPPAVGSAFGGDNPGPPGSATGNKDQTGTGNDNTGNAQNGQDNTGTKVNKTPGDHAWELLWSTDAPLGPTRAPSTDPELVWEEMARRAFDVARSTLVATLAAEGYHLERDINTDVAEHVFGQGFAREMKKLLRDAIRKGMQDGSLMLVSDPREFERLVERIWRGNTPYVRRIRDELRDDLRAGRIRSLEDVASWFEVRAWREGLMGRFLGKQGVSAGFAYARETLTRGTSFIWELGAVKSEHCVDCIGREGGEYSYGELLSIGFPGSLNLECGARCQCAVVEVQSGDNERHAPAMGNDTFTVNSIGTVVDGLIITYPTTISAAGAEGAADHVADQEATLG